ncbi:MAG TPA: GNAT family N-acetyltransferase [Clostridiaceae bacterium]|mgnify:CR=1 FL=1|jgi:RimJ/RimL family protein N-acetyltransferase|nr:GNAT family N-acetyltransferase [Clostridiaceae bacterium]
MRIEYMDIVLRDYKREDIEDDIRWMTVETAWSDWDAPWETKRDIRTFDQDEFTKKALKRLSARKNDHDFRWAFEIDTKDGVHIGGVNCYLNDKEFNWKSRSEGGCLHTLGIEICESSYWYKGLGTQAFAAFIQYYLSRGIDDLYTETWSGNDPMIAVAEKLGFEVCRVDENYRKVNGKLYDGLIFKLNVEKFHDYLNNLII